MIPDIIYVTGNMPIFKYIPYTGELEIDIRENLISQLETSIYKYIVHDIKDFGIIDLDIDEGLWYTFIDKIKESYIEECNRFNIDKSYYKFAWIKIPDSVIFVSENLGVSICTTD